MPTREAAPALRRLVVENRDGVERALKAQAARPPDPTLAGRGVAQPGRRDSYDVRSG